MNNYSIISERIAHLRSHRNSDAKSDIRRLSKLFHALTHLEELDYDFVTDLAQDMPDNMRVLSCAEGDNQSNGFGMTIPLLTLHLFNIQLPGKTPDAQTMRAMTKNFWRRALLILVLQRQEYLRLARREVGEHNQYASSAIVAHRKKQIQMQKDWLKNSQLYTTIAGKPVILPLDKIVKTASQRMARVYAFVAAIDKIAVENDLETALITTTLSGEWHSNPKHKSKNWVWNGASPKDCSDELTKIFQNIRRDLDNAGVYLSGVWCGELHKDGTPHRHYLASYKKEHAALIRATFLKYLPGRLKLRGSSLEEDVAFLTSDDALNNNYTFIKGSRKLERSGFQTDMSIIDRKRGSGSSYVFKYLEKALLKEAAFESNTAFNAIDAARSLWRMRSFDFFGIQKCLGRWDELRRLEIAPIDPLLYENWFAARGGAKEGKIDYVVSEDTGEFVPEQRGDAYKFLLLNGGLSALRPSRVSTARIDEVRDEISLSKKSKTNQYYEDVFVTDGIQHIQKKYSGSVIKIDKKTGEISTYKCGSRSGTPRLCNGWVTTIVSREITRLYDWTIEKKGAEKKRELIAAEFQNYLVRRDFKKNFVGPIFQQKTIKKVFYFSQLSFDTF